MKDFFLNTAGLLPCFSLLSARQTVFSAGRMTVLFLLSWSGPIKFINGNSMVSDSLPVRPVVAMTLCDSAGSYCGTVMRAYLHWYLGRHVICSSPLAYSSYLPFDLKQGKGCGQTPLMSFLLSNLKQRYWISSRASEITCLYPFVFFKVLQLTC